LAPQLPQLSDRQSKPEELRNAFFGGVAPYSTLTAAADAPEGEGIFEDQIPTKRNGLPLFPKTTKTGSNETPSNDWKPGQSGCQKV
jgi:hypothetical protein